MPFKLLAVDTLRTMCSGSCHAGFSEFVHSRSTLFCFALRPGRPDERRRRRGLQRYEISADELWQLLQVSVCCVAW